MSFNISASGTRTSSIVAVPVTYSLGDLPTVGNDSTDSFYLPVTFKDFNATPFTLTNQTLVAGNSVFTVSVEDLAKIRVGDVVSAITAGGVTVPSPTTLSRTAHVYHSQDFIVLTGTSSLPKDGDGISGTGIGAGAVVTRVDTPTRTVFLSVPSTESSLIGAPVSITVTPLVRVLTVDSITRAVTLNSTFTGTGTSVSGSVVITPTAFDPVVFYLECVQTGSTVDRLSVAVRVYPQTGLLAFDANGVGTDSTTISTVPATAIGSFFVNTDAYLTNARKPKVSA